MRPVTPILSNEVPNRAPKAAARVAKPHKVEPAKAKKQEAAPAPDPEPEKKERSTSKRQPSGASQKISSELALVSTNAQSASEHLAKLPAPNDVGTAADLLYMLRETKKAVSDLVKAFESVEHSAQSYLIDNVPKSSQTGAVGRLSVARIVLKQVPHVVDWDKTFAYVAKEKAFDMLQRRLAEKAVTERWENGKTIPGVEPFTALSVSIQKLKT